MKNRGLFKVTCFISVFLAFAASHAEDWTYTVRSGDTLWGLCFQYTSLPLCWQKIGPYNSVEYPRNLSPGTRIRFPVSWLKEQPSPVLASFVKGSVYKTLPDAQPEEINVGDLLVMGTVIRVPVGAVLWLTFANNSMMMVESDSELILDRLSNFGTAGMVDTRVHLRRGSVQTRVPKRRRAHHFEVTTPSSVAAVRGTEFRVTAVVDQMLTRNEVFSGEVMVSNELAERPVPEGKGLVSEKGKALPEPVPLPLAPALKKNSDSKQAMPYILQWQALDGAESYKVEIIDDMKGALQGLETTNATEITLSDMPETCYSVRVSGINMAGFQGMPAEQQLCLFMPLPAPEFIESATAADDKMSVVWREIPSAAQYKLEASLSKRFEPLLFSEYLVHPNFDLPSEHKGSVYLRVVAIDDDANEGHMSEVYRVRQESLTEEKTGLMFTTFLMFALLLL